MNWDGRTQGLLDELVKISAFNTRGLSPETVMSGSQPPPPMETAGFSKARDILGRASQTKTAASRHVRRALPMQPGLDRLTHQGDESGTEKAKSVAGYGLAGLGTGGAIHKAYSSMPKVFEGMNRLPGAENAIAQHASRIRNNAIGNKLMLGGAALGTGYGAYRQYVKGKQNQPPAQVKQGTITKLSYEIEPEDRPNIKKKDFAQPNKEEAGHKGKYPIPDRQHAKSALGFAKMHGDTAAYAAVRKKVKAKFPDMLQEKTSARLGGLIPEAGSKDFGERFRYFHNQNDMLHGGKIFGQFRGDFQKRLDAYTGGDDSALKPKTVKEKKSTVSSPGMALKASQQVGKKKVAPSNTGPSTTTQIRGQLVGRKGIP